MLSSPCVKIRAKSGLKAQLPYRFRVLGRFTSCGPGRIAIGLCSAAAAAGCGKGRDVAAGGPDVGVVSAEGLKRQWPPTELRS
jgi:hypothetical protein